MYYTAKDILSSPAEAIIVPVRLGSKKITRLQKRIITLCGDDYMEDLIHDIKQGALAIELPSFYVPAKEVSPRIIINFPIRMKNYTPGEDLAEFVTNLRALFSMCESWNITSFGIGELENGLGWDQLENLVMRFETSREAQRVEVWYHPPEEKDEMVEEQTLTHA